MGLLLAVFGLATATSRGLPNPAPAPSQVPVLVTAAALTYVPGDKTFPEGSLTIHQGTQVYFSSLDVIGGSHWMLSDEYDAHGDHLFASDDQVGAGQITKVSGTASLPPRSYHFYCSNHPLMTGILVVIP